MKPTLYLRWHEAEYKEETGPCAASFRAWPEVGPTAYVLQQWWTDGKTGEWRTITEGYGDGKPEGA